MAKPQIHPAANIPTPLSDDEYAVLKANIAEYGLLDPITLHKGKVLDGRHRLRACEELGIVPRYVEDDELTEFGGVPEFFVEARLARRNMTPSQKAIVAAKLKPVYEKRAKERQKAAGGDKCSAKAKSKAVQDTCPEPIDGSQARDEAGATHGVSGRSVSRAENVLAAGCKQLIQAVEADRIDVTLAEKVAKAYSGDELAEVVAVAMACEKPAAALKEKVKSEPVVPKKKRWNVPPRKSGADRITAASRKAAHAALIRLTGALDQMGILEKCHCYTNPLKEEIDRA